MTAKNTMNQVNAGFKEAFYKLDYFKWRGVRQEIQDVFGWSRPTFFSKRNGNRKLTKAEKIVLKSLFEKYGIELQN